MSYVSTVLKDFPGGLNLEIVAAILNFQQVKLVTGTTIQGHYDLQTPMGGGQQVVATQWDTKGNPDQILSTDAKVIDV